MSADAQGPTPDALAALLHELVERQQSGRHVEPAQPDEQGRCTVCLKRAEWLAARGVRLGAPEQEPGATSGAPLHQAGWESAWVAWGKRQGAIRDGVTLDEILHAYLGAARGGTLREAAQAYFQVMDEAEAITEGRLPPRMGCAEEYQAAEAALRAALSGRTPGDAP